MTGHIIMIVGRHQLFTWLHKISALRTPNPMTLTIFLMKEKSYQSAGVTVMHDMSAIEFAVTTGAGYLNFWEYQEVMITCGT